MTNALPQTSAAHNLKGAFLMVFSMLAFAIEDALIKFLSDTIPLWLIIAVIGFGCGLFFSFINLRNGTPAFTRAALHPAVILRCVSDAVGAWAFLTALTLVPLATASAILQAAPILVTLGAALFLRETVGPRRWTAIGIGFLGVLLILRPTSDGFDTNVLYAVLGVTCLATRDLCTRRVPDTINTMQMSELGTFSLLPVAIWLWFTTPAMTTQPNTNDWILLAILVPIGMMAYATITSAARIGEISFVTPFRYSRMVFALIIGIIVFSEVPDAFTLIGVSIIIGSGLYMLWRERRIKTRHHET